MTASVRRSQPGAGWRKDGGARRGKASAADPAVPGDYLPSGVYTDLRALGFPASGVLTNTFYVEGVRRCAAAASGRIAARLDPDGPGPMGWTELDAVRVTVLKIGLIPDYDRDGKIDETDRDKAASGEVFRFWINDDKDVGDVAVDGSDVPGQSDGNCSDDVVNGRCDLLDFFPVWIDLKHILAVLPPGNGVEYRLRGRGLKFVYTALTDERAGSYLREECNTCGIRLNQKAFEAATLPVGDVRLESEVELSGTFLSAVQVDGNRGVLMVEGVSTFASLHLDVVRSATDELIASAHLPLSLSKVEDMYRTVNLRGMMNPGVLTEPPNNPDAGKSKNLVFLHGYQPDAGESGDMTAWLSEMFKRFHQSGSSAKFHGVLWFSNQGDAMDYQKNVVNAFSTAPLLKAYVDGLSGPVVAVAHSLGNMVVSSAIVDQEMTVSKYMLCDAAVASEAYDATIAQEANLVNEWWAAYDPRTWAANWYLLFEGTGNSRQNLKWRDRFADMGNLTEAWNFYSTGDEVFDLTATPGLFAGTIGVNVNWWFILPISVNVNVNFGRHSWQKQELFKGTRYSDGWNSFGGTIASGWGFESTLVETTHFGESAWEVASVYTNAAGANAASDAALRNCPVFKRTPDWLVGTNEMSQFQIDETLGMGIPALTPSTGRTIIPSFGDEQYQINLNSTSGSGYKPNDWPTTGHTLQDAGQWLHNDMKDVAYFFTYKLFDKIVTEGGLK